MEDIQRDFLPDVNLTVDEHIKKQFSETAKWSKFVSIIMFIAAGIILVMGVVATTLLAGTMDRIGGGIYSEFLSMGGGIVILVVVGLSAAIGIIYYFLYSFSVKMKKSLFTDDREEFAKGLRMLKIFFIISTIVAIISLLSDIGKLF